ncbi:MAG: class I SAM-dependent methyltransferase [Infirmifilum sp.]
MSRSPILDFGHNMKQLRKVLEKARDIRGDVQRYLDVGAGDCALTEFVVRVLEPKEVLALDIDPEGLEICKSRGFKIKCKGHTTSRELRRCDNNV